MLCTDCSMHVKPIVAIDIDGTLGDYHGHLIKFAFAYLGLVDDGDWHIRTYAGDEPFRDWFTRELRVDLSVFRAIKLAYRQGGMKRSMPPYEGACTLVHTLRSRGAEVWLTTTRPYLRLDNVDPDTRFWLDRHSIEYDGMLYDKDKYKLLAEYVDPARVVAVLDDLPEQYDAAMEEFGSKVPILRRNGYNRSVNRPRMSETLRGATEVIASLVTNWEAKRA